MAPSELRSSANTHVVFDSVSRVPISANKCSNKKLEYRGASQFLTVKWAHLANIPTLAAMPVVDTLNKAFAATTKGQSSILLSFAAAVPTCSDSCVNDSRVMYAQSPRITINTTPSFLWTGGHPPLHLLTTPPPLLTPLALLHHITAPPNPLARPSIRHHRHVSQTSLPSVLCSAAHQAPAKTELLCTDQDVKIDPIWLPRVQDTR